jgi:hypothetical protein
MNERTVRLLTGDRPGRRAPRPDGLDATVAMILSTSRRDSADLVLDYPLWIAALRAVTKLFPDAQAVVRAPATQVLGGWLGTRRGKALGDLDEYLDRLQREGDAMPAGEAAWRSGRSRTLSRQLDHPVSLPPCGCRAVAGRAGNRPPGRWRSYPAR